MPNFLVSPQKQFSFIIKELIQVWDALSDYLMHHSMVLCAISSIVKMAVCRKVILGGSSILVIKLIRTTACENACHLPRPLTC